MKILLSAIACNPLTGSEAAVGWTVAATIAQRHEVHVLTHEFNRDAFELWQQTHTLPENLHLHYCGINKGNHPNRLIARIASWTTYQKWMRDLMEPAEKLHEKIRFDLIHHVTYATWRVASPLWQLGIPFVWGPLGGGELFPWRFSGILSPMALAFEMARASSNFLSLLNSRVRRCAKNSTVCVAGNRETFDILQRLRGTKNGLSKLCVSFFERQQVEALASLSHDKTTDGPLRIFAGGNLEGRKGVAIVLKALAKVQSRNVKFTYRLGGIGPELKHLQKLSAKLGLSGSVTFGQTLRGDAYHDELMKSHIYLLPSLRDNSGRTLMEAMLAGCVPIVGDCGGPGEIVTDECGYRVKVSDSQQMAEDITEIICKVDSDRGLIRSLGKAASQRIATDYSQDSYLESIEKIYSEALKGHGVSHS